MGINSRSALDPRWIKHHKGIAASFMLATIRVVRKVPQANLTYNQTTRAWSGSFETIFEGQARIQPYGIIGDQIVGQDPTGRRLMRVQIAEVNSPINLDDTILITSNPTDAALEKFTLEVRGTIGSSNAWVTDLVCEANLKHAE